jgi:hypothetical protein
MPDQELIIRKILSIVEETFTESGKQLERPTRKAAAIAVIKNPYAAKYVEDLSLFYAYGEQLGDLLVKKALEALAVRPEQAGERIDSYGKGIIVGLDGELEHAHAIMHPKFGAPVRKSLGGPDYCKAIMSSTAKVASIGASIDIPLTYKRAIWVVSHFDAMTVSVPEAPKRDEILVALALTDSGRPLARTIGLQKHEAKGLDGLK